jgi:D-3-phosphoglycerate dehydrogenase/C-terminal binding protein
LFLERTINRREKAMADPRGKVVITDYVSDTDEEAKILGLLADVTTPLAQSEDDLTGCVEDADALMVYHFVQLTERTIGRLQKCRLIVRCGVGYDNVDVRSARRHGIPVANVPDYGTEEVADSAIGLMLAMTRGFALLERRMRERRGRWSPAEAGPLRRLRDRVFGIVGLGRIGKATALRAKSLGLDVAFYDPYVPDGTDKSLGIRRVETLDELLAMSHVVSMHCPLTDETTHMIDAVTLARMREGSYLVNTARGAVVDARAVLDAIASGHLAGAALDVLEREPPDEDDPVIVAWRDPAHPAYDRLIINPHAAFYSLDGLRDMRIKGAQNIRRVLQGHPPRNVVN